MFELEIDDHAAPPGAHAAAYARALRARGRVEQFEEVFDARDDGAAAVDDASRDADTDEVDATWPLVVQARARARAMSP